MATPATTSTTHQGPQVGRAFTIDGREIITRIIKYAVEGLVVAIAAWALPARPPSLEETAVMGLVAASVFALLDLYAPSISTATRQGVGLGLGSGLVGGIPIR
jgi:hypothetical protein